VVNRLDDPILGERWYTVLEAASEVKRSPKTVRNLVSVHQLPRRLVRRPGRGKRKMLLLSSSTVKQLRELTLGF
jgi:hypothetical protein